MTAPTILVVEDEALIRMFATDIAEEAGYRVIEAVDGGDAMLKLEANPDIGIVFTDIHMPGDLDGLAMAHQAKTRRPSLRFLIVSGHRLPSEVDLPPDSRFIPKPYGVGEIASALGELAEAWTPSAQT
ncbi:MAG: response regulator [Pseudomonadota bacterium]|nr:response regulator [Pseudomonadota bacterium]